MFSSKDETNLEPIKTHILTSSFVYLFYHLQGWFLDEEFEYTCTEKFAWMKKAEFVTCNLKEIKALLVKFFIEAAL